MPPLDSAISSINCLNIKMIPGKALLLEAIEFVKITDALCKNFRIGVPGREEGRRRKSEKEKH
jgi:hypothetical protein